MKSANDFIIRVHVEVIILIKIVILIHSLRMKYSWILCLKVNIYELVYTEACWILIIWLI